MFYGQEWARNKLWQHLIALSMQFIGYGIAGLARSCIVYPDYCIWPSLLPTIVLNRSLHEKSSHFEFRVWGRLITPFRWLVTLTVAYFIWHMYNSPPFDAYFMTVLGRDIFSSLSKTSIGSHGLLQPARFWH